MTTLTPKFDFLKDKRAASTHADAMAAPTFRHAASMAMLEYQRRLLPSDDSNPQLLAGTTLRLAGAQGFLNVLLNLGEADKQQDIPAPTGLQTEEDFWQSQQKPSTPKQPRPSTKG